VRKGKEEEKGEGGEAWEWGIGVIKEKKATGTISSSKWRFS